MYNNHIPLEPSPFSGPTINYTLHNILYCTRYFDHTFRDGRHSTEIVLLLLCVGSRIYILYLLYRAEPMTIRVLLASARDGILLIV